MVIGSVVSSVMKDYRESSTVLDIRTRSTDTRSLLLIPAYTGRHGHGSPPPMNEVRAGGSSHRERERETPKLSLRPAAQSRHRRAPVELPTTPHEHQAPWFSG